MKRHNFHIQIALVGGQPTPVYQGIVHLHPDQVMLICSRQTRNVAEHIRGQLPFYEDKNVMIYEVSDANVELVYQTAVVITQTLQKGITISLNLTSGLKLWSLVFHQVFRRYRRSCLNFYIGQDGTFFDLKERKTQGKVDFDMDTQFEILGHKLDEFTPLSDYTEADYRVLDKVCKLGFGVRTHEKMRSLTQAFYEGYSKRFQNLLLRQDYEVSQGNCFLSWEAESRTFECQIAEFYQKFSSEHVGNIVLNTGWFELYVASFIAEIYGKENVRMNCVFRNVSNLPKNEIDIVVNTGSKLVFVECKTQVKNTTDIDKFCSVVRNYGGLGTKPLFVTNSPMRPDAQEKCNDHRITTFYLNNPAYRHDRAITVEALKTLMKEELEKKWNV